MPHFANGFIWLLGPIQHSALEDNMLMLAGSSCMAEQAEFCCIKSAAVCLSSQLGGAQVVALQPTSLLVRLAHVMCLVGKLV